MNQKFLTLTDHFSDNMFNIIKEASIRCKDKECFNGLNIGAVSVIELITKDYLQCISLYIQTGSKETYLDKIRWFKVMASSRMPSRNIKGDLLDFSNILKSITLEYINDNGKIARAFDDFSEIVESVYCEVD